MKTSVCRPHVPSNSIRRNLPTGRSLHGLREEFLLTLSPNTCDEVWLLAPRSFRGTTFLLDIFCWSDIPFGIQDAEKPKPGKEKRCISSISVLGPTDEGKGAVSEESLKGKVPELYQAGDCVEVRWLLEGIHEGAHAALKT